MKQKIFNKLLTISNLIFCILVAIQIIVFGNKAFINVEYSFNVIQKDGDIILKLIALLCIILLILNIIAIIKNRKDKKLRFWYAVTVFIAIRVIITTIVDNFDYNWDTEIISTVNNIVYYTFYVIIPIIIAMKYIIHTLKIERNKTKAVFYIFPIIISIIGCFAKVNQVVWFVVAIIFQFIRNTKENENKLSTVRTVLNIIIYGALLLLEAYIAIRIVTTIITLYSVDQKSTIFINEISQNLEEQGYNDNILIPVKYNGKWGYINQDGKEIVQCEYDNVYELSGVYNNIIVIAQKSNYYYIISNTGKVLTINESSPVPWIAKEKIEKSPYVYNISISQINEIIQKTQSINIYTEIAADDDYDEYYENDDVLYPYENSYNRNNNIVYNYKLENGNRLDIEEIYLEDKEEYTYNLTLSENNKIILQEKNMGIKISSDGELELYTDGSIPFYDIENRIQGYIDTKNVKKDIIEGDYEILDVNDKQIIVREYIDDDIKEKILDKNTHNVLVEAKAIDEIDNGYIIKYEDKDYINDKWQFLDKDLNIKIQNYDYIYEYIYVYNRLICVMRGLKVDKKVLMNTKGEILTNKDYELMGEKFEIDWDTIDRNTEYILDEIYDEYYVS